MAASDTTNDQDSDTMRNPQRDNLALVVGIIASFVAISGLSDDTELFTHSMWVPAGAVAGFAGLWAVLSTTRSLFNARPAQDLPETDVDH